MKAGKEFGEGAEVYYLFTGQEGAVKGLYWCFCMF